MKPEESSQHQIQLVEPQSAYRLQDIRGGFCPAKKGTVTPLQYLGGQRRITEPRS